MAGRGGLNLTHSENHEKFVGRYGIKQDILARVIKNFSPDDLRKWCDNLGQETFIGTSGRVFPKSLKASPLLRAWLQRLQDLGVKIHTHHNWIGWDKENLIFQTPNGIIPVQGEATLFTLGGATWPKLGSDGSWTGLFEKAGIQISPLQPANCGFHVNWSDIMRYKFAGTPLKSITISHQNHLARGEIMISAYGVEGGGIYALSANIREDIYKNGSARIEINLKPDLTQENILERLSKPKGKLSLSNFLKKYLNLSPVAIGLLMENNNREWLGRASPQDIYNLITALPITLNAPFSMDRAISTAGGISFDELNENLMLCKMPGVFVAGEMLDWEAPTGGYLLQACFATGHHAANSIAQYLSRTPNTNPE